MYVDNFPASGKSAPGLAKARAGPRGALLSYLILCEGGAGGRRPGTPGRQRTEGCGSKLRWGFPVPLGAPHFHLCLGRQCSLGARWCSKSWRTVGTVGPHGQIWVRSPDAVAQLCPFLAYSPGPGTSALSPVAPGLGFLKLCDQRPQGATATLGVLGSVFSLLHDSSSGWLSELCQLPARGHVQCQRGLTLLCLPLRSWDSGT